MGTAFSIKSVVDYSYCSICLNIVYKTKDLEHFAVVWASVPVVHLVKIINISRGFMEQNRGNPCHLTHFRQKSRKK